MKSGSKKFEIAIVLVVLALLGVMWAINGYEDTWLYITALVIAVPVSWFALSKKNIDR